MYTSETKVRQSQALIRLGVNSKKILSNLPSTTIMNAKIKDRESQITVSSQFNKAYVSKSKFTVSRTSKFSKQPSNVSLVAQANVVMKKEIRKPDTVKPSTIKSTPVNKVVITKSSSLNKKTGKRRNQSPADKEKIKPDLSIKNINTTETSTQTNESEILDHLLIVGDVKVITPSKSVIDDIDKSRKEAETKKLLMATRKFDEHSELEEQQLDELKEYLDNSFITRKAPNLRRHFLEEDRKLIQSMDELLLRERPKNESITDIKTRIKQKEQQLLSLFDRFKKNDPFGKTSV